MPIRLLRSTETGHVPTSLESGQIAINEADGILFWRDADGEVQSCPIKTLAEMASVIDGGDF